MSLLPQSTIEAQPHGMFQTSKQQLEASLLTEDAKSFLLALHYEFDSTRKELLKLRQEKQHALNSGYLPSFLPSTQHIRNSDWQVAYCPEDLQDRRVEITGPAEAKMMINALNSGAKVFMADLEDSLSPNWQNILEGHQALKDAVRHNLIFFDNKKSKAYSLNDEIATLIVRPRGLHLQEKNMRVSSTSMSASFFDFGLYMYHNAKERLARGTAPYFYLPKIESHLEARLWREVIEFTEERLGIPRGSVRVTMLVETIHAAFEMEEMLFELREYASGLNAGRWDYIFSFIKAFHKRSDCILPDRKQITMSVPFMKAYSEQLVKVCHKRGAHAIGGMSAYIPNRNDTLANEKAFRSISKDKHREAQQGFDGTWVAHPDLIAAAKAEFDKALGKNSHQKARLREDVNITGLELLNPEVPQGKITEEGMRQNINVVLQYMAAWLSGKGAVAINNLMEDAATAEISRAQLWQWVCHGVTLADGRQVDHKMYRELRDDEFHKLGNMPNLNEAAELLDEMIVCGSFKPFLTMRAYGLMEGNSN